MQGKFLPNVSLMAVAASYVMQIGAGVFALSIVGRVITAAPPRSLAILEGPYRYDSNAFWQIMPAITGVLFVIALVANWKTRRRPLLVTAFTVFLLSGVITVAFVAPIFAEVAGVGFSDAVDPALQRRASMWYMFDWAARGVDAIAGALLLSALTRPAANA